MIGSDIHFSGIQTLNIGSGITSLGSLGVAPTTVNCYAEVPPTCESGTFSNYDGSHHIPSQSTTAYFTASYWQNFNNLSNDITSIVTLDRSTATMTQWDELTLKATVNPDDAALKWSTSNPAVATIDDNGLVTATGVGECYIYVRLADNDAVYTRCGITASYPEIILSLNKKTAEINVGEELTLTLTITPDNTGLTPALPSTKAIQIVGVSNGTVTVADTEGRIDPATIRVRVVGDLNNNHVADITDVNILINIILGRDDAANYDDRAYITEGDTVVDITDLNLLFNLLLAK